MMRAANTLNLASPLALVSAAIFALGVACSPQAEAENGGKVSGGAGGGDGDPAPSTPSTPSTPSAASESFNRAWACTAAPYDAPFVSGNTALQPAELNGGPSGLTDNLEGVVWIGDRLLFSHIQYNADLANPAEIYEYVNGATKIFLDDSGSNGLAMHPNGTLIAATHGNRNLTRIDLKTKATTLIVTELDGQPDPKFNSPNDLAIRSDGVIYFTDPNWQAWGDGTTVTGNNLYVVQPDGSALTVVTPFRANQGGPNGVLLSLDEKTLYVGGNGWDRDAAPLAAYAVNADGSLQPFSKWPPTDPSVHAVDGLTMDCAGNLYLTDQDVLVYSPAGEQLGKIVVGGGVTNLAFGGTDGRTLFISKQNPARILSIEMPLPGLAY